MNRVIKKYIQNCHSCRRVKTSRDKYNEKLKFLSIFKKIWKNFILNFVNFFRCSNRYNVILMIINEFSKKRHYIFCDIEKEKISVKIIVKMLIQHVWKLHDLSLIIVLNQEFEFISIVWKILCKILNIVFKFSTAFYLETDKLSKITNQQMKRHSRTFCNYYQNN